MWRSGVRLVCPPVPSFARRCCGFAAGCSVGTRCRSIAARPALSSKRGQCHVISRRRKLNTVLSLLCCELYKCSEWLEMMAPADFGSGFGDTAVTNTRFFTQGRHLSGKHGNVPGIWQLSGKYRWKNLVVENCPLLTSGSRLHRCLVGCFGHVFERLYSLSSHFWTFCSNVDHVIVYWWHWQKYMLEMSDTKWLWVPQSRGKCPGIQQCLATGHPVYSIL